MLRNRIDLTNRIVHLHGTAGVFKQTLHSCPPLQLELSRIYTLSLLLLHL
ncbi:hypothetical protein LguiB_036109 [Lonicera macranthoides]